MAESPKTFSTKWFDGPMMPSRRRVGFQHTNRWLVRLFGKFPGTRGLAIMAVTFLVFSSFVFASPGVDTDAISGGIVGQIPDRPNVQFDDPAPTSEADINTGALTVDENGGDGAVVPDLNLEGAQPTEAALTPDGLLPNYRILSFYGFPGNPDLGILGEYGPDLLLEELKKQAEEYEEADPDHPVMLAMEVIATVAQRDPQADGSYLLDTPTSVLDQYAEFTKDNGILLLLDVQIGYRTVEMEMKALEPWLKQEHVHLALDPEFAMQDGQIPGDHIGQIDASDINLAQQWLNQVANANGLSPRLLIVHQFHEGMIENKEKIVPISGVQLILDADGFGSPDLKTEVYNYIQNVIGVPDTYAGVKLFYQKDVPLMSAEDIVNLDPSPLFVMYQ